MVLGTTPVTRRPPTSGVEAVTPPPRICSTPSRSSAIAGKHVFCEKPLALTKKGAEAVVGACARNNLVLGMGHERLEPPVAQMLAMARPGQLTDPAG
jgi:hypothetical protein